MKLAQNNKLKLFILCFGLLLFPFQLFAQSEEGESTTIYSTDSSSGSKYLLSSGGTNQGGQSVQADEFSGAASYSVPIPIPPARGGIKPDLSLNYHSYRRNYNSWVGLGWELDMGAVERTPGDLGRIDYANGESFQVRLSGQTETLVLKERNISGVYDKYGVYISEGLVVDEYRAENESSFNIYLFVKDPDREAYTLNLRWIVIDKSGTAYTFGGKHPDLSYTREDGRYCPDGSTVDDCEKEHWVSRWLLTNVDDPNGNQLNIWYDDSLTLKSIKYQDIEIKFHKVLGEDDDSILYRPIFRQGFLRYEQLAVEITDIEVWQSETTLLSRFQFDIERDDYSGLAQLSKITQCVVAAGSDCPADYPGSLPPTSFTYYGQESLGFKTEAQEYNASAETSAGYVLGAVNYNSQLIDMNGDGLVDHVVAPANATEIEIHFNNGNDFDEVAVSWPDPAAIDCSDKDNNCLGGVHKHYRQDAAKHQFVFLMDFNGDTLPDRIRTVVSEEDGHRASFLVYLHNGSGWDDTAQVWEDPFVGDSPGSIDQKKSLIDMNGDGLVDRVVGEPDRRGYDIYFNNGTGFDAEAEFWADPVYEEDPLFTGTGEIYSIGSHGLRGFIRDFNGDGLPDRIFSYQFTYEETEDSKPGGLGVFLNQNGKGWAFPVEDGDGDVRAYEAAYLQVYDPIEDSKYDGQIAEKYDWIDMNGDGYLDRVEGIPDEGIFRVYFFQGQNSSSDSRVLSEPYEIKDPLEDVDGEWAMSGYINKSHEDWTTGGDQYLFFKDMNGDGYLDRVSLSPRRKDESEKKYLVHFMDVNAVQFSDSPEGWENQDVSQPINALKSIDDGQGNKMIVEYMPSSLPLRSSGPDHRFLPFNLNVVRKIYTTDYTMPGTDDDLEAIRYPGMRWTTYSFYGGNVYYRDIASRGSRLLRFNGFQEIRKQTHKARGEDWDPVISKTYFHQTLGDVEVLTETEKAYFDPDGYAHYSFAGKPYKQVVQDEGTGQVLSQELSNWVINEDSEDPYYKCDGACFPQLQNRTKSIWEPGEALSRDSWVEYEFDDIGNITNETHYSGDGELIFEQVTEYYEPESFGSAYVRDRPSKQYKQADGEILRQKEFSYDYNGNPSIETYLFDSSSGRTISVTRSFNSDGTLKTETSSDGVTTTFTYDDDGLFPVTETVIFDAGSMVTNASYNRLNGTKATQEDSYGVQSEKEYDEYGRAVAEYVISSSGKRTLLGTMSYEYETVTLNGWPGIVLQKVSTYQFKEGYPDTESKPLKIVYQDASGQPLQACQYTERGNYRMVQTRRQNAGRLEIKTEPVFKDNCDFVSELSSSVNLYRSYSDHMGRTVYVDPPEGDAGSPVAEVSISYSTNALGQLVQTTETSLGDKKTEVFDHSERLLSLTDPDGNKLEYVYNGVGDLETVLVDGSELISMKYNAFGKKTQMTDANLGTWVYEYDRKGRLERQIDGKGNVVETIYDDFSRLERKNHYDASETLERYTLYLYDSGDSVHDVQVGELYAIEEYLADGTLIRSTKYGYDEDYRRKTKVTKNFPELGEFEQSTVFNDRGLAVSTHYPGGESLYFEYGRTDEVIKVCSNESCDPSSGEVYYQIDPSTAYDVYGHLLAEQFGNGVLSSYAYYDNSGRLKNKKTYKGDQTYSERTYTYDEYANIKTIGDPLGLQGTGALDAVEYDNLSRLTSYKVVSTGETHSLTYDNQGNILTNSEKFGSTPYEYTSSRPHAVTKIGERSFDYDENGNLVSDDKRTLEYDARNKLTKVTMKNGTVVEYDYDYSGMRVLKKSTRKDPAGYEHTKTTYYLGEVLEIKDNQMVFNVSAGGSRVATKALGSLEDLLGATSASLKDSKITLAKFTSAKPYAPGFMMMFALLFIAMFRPVFQKTPVWAFRYLLRGRYFNRRRLSFSQKCLCYVAKKMLTLRRFTQAMGQALAELPLNTAPKLVGLLLAFVFVINTSVPAWAGDTGAGTAASSDETYFYYHHGDHLGSSHVLTEGSKEGGKHAGITYAQGDLLQRIEYSPYGQESFVLNPGLKFDPRFTGQEYDVSTGLYYYKARYYDPEIGRFIQPDTVIPSAKDYQSFNRYSYVRNNPLKYVDPTGHFWGFFKKILGAFLGALIGVLVTMAVLSGFGIGFAGLGAMLAQATFGQAMLAGAAGGLVGGAVGGGISAGLKGALYGALIGGVTGALSGGVGKWMQTLSAGAKLAFSAVSISAGAGLSYAKGGWKGIVIFGAGLAGGMLGAKIGKGFGPAIGGSVIEGKATAEDIINAENYGPFDRKFDSYEQFADSLKDGDIVFGKRPLSIMNTMGGTSLTDELNLDIAHEHVFWKQDGVVYNKGFTTGGTFEDILTGPKGKIVLQSYRFGPVLHGGNIEAMNQVISQYDSTIKYNLLGPNCQDFSDAVRETLY
ncbi:MAG: hypothetical protein H7A33_00485 [Deltaproteobacteria bacterium]|nr:hypothetical protein [Deltaproteobacteria bacterium]